MRQKMRSWGLQLRSDKNIEDLGRMFYSTINGWINYFPVLAMADSAFVKELATGTGTERTIAVDGFNKSQNSTCLFALTVEDHSMQPVFDSGDLVVIDGELSAKPGDYVLACLPAKKQSVLRKYGEASGSVFQLLASNELWVLG